MQSDVRCTVCGKEPCTAYTQHTLPRQQPARSHNVDRRRHRSQLPLLQPKDTHKRLTRLLVNATTYPRPSNNIFKRVDQDLLPNGAPNTSWRRLLVRIKTTQSLPDLQRIWSTYHPKTSIWRHEHEAAVVTKAVALSYPAALLVPEKYVAWLPGANLATDHKRSSGFTATQQLTATKQSGSTAQPYTENVRPASNTRSQNLGSPSGFHSVPADLQQFLDVINQTTINPDALESLSGTTIARLLVCCVRLGCHLSDVLLSDLLGELYREGGQKLQTISIDLLAQLSTAMLSLHPPTGNVSAAVSGDFEVEDKAPAVNLLLQPPLLLPATATTTFTASSGSDRADSHHRYQSTNKHTNGLQLVMTSQHQQPHAKDRLGHAPQTLTFQEYLQMYSAAPPPVEPLNSTSKPAGSPADKPRAYRLSRTVIWLGLARAAIGAVSNRKGNQAAGARSSDICQLASALAHAGCLEPALCDSFLQTLLNPSSLRSMPIHAAQDAIELPGSKQQLPLLGLHQNIATQEVDAFWPHTLTTLQGCAEVNETDGSTDRSRPRNDAVRQIILNPPYPSPMEPLQLDFKHVRLSRLPYNPRALADLAVTLTLCKINSSNQTSMGSTTSLQLKDWLFGTGGVLHRFVTLLPEATLDDITRVTWALAQLYKRTDRGMVSTANTSIKQPTTSSKIIPVQSRLGHDTNATADTTTHQGVLRNVASLLFKHMATKKFKWTTHHLITCMEVYTDMYPLLPVECMAYFAALPLRQPSLLSSCLLAALQRLAGVLATSSKLALNLSPAATRTHSKRQASASGHLDVGAASLEACKELRRVLSRTAPSIICILARQLPQLSVEGLLAMLRLVVVARQCKVSDVVAAAPRTVLVAVLLETDDSFRPDNSDLDVMTNVDLAYELGLPACEVELLQLVQNRLIYAADIMTVSTAAELAEALHKLQDVETAHHLFNQTLTLSQE